MNLIHLHLKDVLNDDEIIKIDADISIIINPGPYRRSIFRSSEFPGMICIATKGNFLNERLLYYLDPSDPNFLVKLDELIVIKIEDNNA